MELATLQWVSWFNHHRLLEPIGYIPPAEAEANYYRNSPIRPPWWWPDLNQPASTIPGAVQLHDRQHVLQFRNARFRLTCISASHTASDMSNGPPGCEKTTLLTKMSIRPIASMQSSTTRFT